MLMCIYKARQQPSATWTVLEEQLELDMHIRPLLAASTGHSRPPSNNASPRGGVDAVAPVSQQDSAVKGGSQENTPRSSRQRVPPLCVDVVTLDGGRVNPDSPQGGDDGLRPSPRGRQRMKSRTSELDGLIAGCEVNTSESKTDQPKIANSDNVEKQPSRSEAEHEEDVAANNGSGLISSTVSLSSAAENQLPEIPEVAQPEVENRRAEGEETAEPGEENETTPDEVQEDPFEDLPMRAPYQDPPVFKGHTNYGFEFFPSWAEIGAKAQSNDASQENDSSED